MWIEKNKKAFFGKFKKESNKCEVEVSDLLINQKGGTCKKSNINEDIKKHVDLWWTDENGITHGIDVKMPKKTRRTDIESDNERTWIEILNVCGKPGWIDGEEEWIAFVRSGKYNDVLFVNRKKLSSFIKRKTKKSKIFEYNTGVAYDLYTRKKWGNNDLCTIVPFEDMKPFIDFTLKII